MDQDSLWPPFTQIQLEYIDDRIKTIVRDFHTSQPADYHSLQEIRQLIWLNLESLHQEFAEHPFRLPVLTHVLTKYTVMRSKDNEVQKNSSTRWEHQVSLAVLSKDALWPAQINPIQPFRNGNARGMYRFITS